jgi:hypothetical protein
MFHVTIWDITYIYIYIYIVLRFRGAIPVYPTPRNREIEFVSSSFSFRACRACRAWRCEAVRAHVGRCSYCWGSRVLVSVHVCACLLQCQLCRPPLFPPVLNSLGIASFLSSQLPLSPLALTHNSPPPSFHMTLNSLRPPLSTSPQLSWPLSLSLLLFPINSCITSMNSECHLRNVARPHTPKTLRPRITRIASMGTPQLLTQYFSSLSELAKETPQIANAAEHFQNAWRLCRS